MNSYYPSLAIEKVIFYYQLVVFDIITVQLFLL
jgi:hypothetical protein